MANAINLHLQLQRLADTIQRYKAKIPIQNKGKKYRFAEHILVTASDFVRESLLGIADNIKAARYAYALSSTRPLFELCSKVLWAARNEDGWVTLYVRSEKRMTKWMRRCIATLADGVPDQARKFLSEKEAIDAKLPSAKQLPEKLREFVEDNDRRDLQAGVFASGSSGTCDVSYVAVYEMLCLPTHGNVAAITGGFGFTGMSTISTCTVFSTRALLSAIHILHDEDPRLAWNALKPIASISLLDNPLLPPGIDE